MSFEYYKEVKGRGDTSAFLLKDGGIKLFPLCLNLRKFKHNNINHFVSLNISFEILFDIENYFTIGFDFFHYLHHQSHLNKGQFPRFTIKRDPLYSPGNEEKYLPHTSMIEVLHNEEQVLNFIKESMWAYEKEQDLQLWSTYLKYWQLNKKNVLKKSNIVDNSEMHYEWKNLFQLFSTYEQHYTLKGKI